MNKKIGKGLKTDKKSENYKTPKNKKMQKPKNAPPFYLPLYILLLHTLHVHILLKLPGQVLTVHSKKVKICKKK